jgi:primosomal protein N' (replication factor Y)
MSGGYATALILDAGISAAHVSLDTSVVALRRWLAAAHLVVPAAAGGQVLLVGDGDPAATAALVRFDPVLLAERELEMRLEAGMPPAVRLAEIMGDAVAVEAVTSRVALAVPETTLGPMAVSEAETEPDSATQEMLFDEPKVRVIIRVPSGDGAELARQLRASLAVRSAKREPGAVKVTLDPAEFG